MNLKNISNIIQEKYEMLKFKEDISDIKNGAGVLTLKTRAYLPKVFEHPFLITIYVYEEGSIVILFTFAEIDKKLKYYKAINEFNVNTMFKAYIEEHEDMDLFRVQYINHIFNDEQALKITGFVLSRLMMDDVTKFLQKIFNV